LGLLDPVHIRSTRLPGKLVPMPTG
jgi:hypothetical protein